MTAGKIKEGRLILRKSLALADAETESGVETERAERFSKSCSFCCSEEEDDGELERERESEEGDSRTSQLR